MKKILYIIGVFLLFAACSKEEITPQEQGTIQKSFSLSIEEPDYAPQSRAKVEMSRYLLEMYEGDLNAQPVKMNSPNGEFKVTLKKGVDYVCLFWADGGEASYNAADLKAVTQTDETALGTAAYSACVTINSKSNGAISLKRAVAELSFIDKNGLTENTNELKITYPYASAALNVGEGTVTRTAGTTIRTITGITPPDLATDAFTTDFILAPTEAGQLAGLKFQLNQEEEKTIASLAVQANFRTKITGEYQVPPTPSMSFTINTTKNTANTADKTFILPLAETFSGYDLTVDWGDDEIETFASGTTLDENNMLHTYSSAGEYTITITSTQLDPTQQQMPKLAFGENYKDVANNPAKLISLDSPLLNMGADLSFCFSKCPNLTTIPANLFTKNIDATDFSYCFEVCTGLTKIPAELFAKNTAATNFTYCFADCTGLTAIPAGLFTANAEAASFSHCFQLCSELTAVPELLFEKNTAATNFYCCFDGCTKLVLNANIFCTETVENKATRFAEKRMNFIYCFRNCGSNASVEAGQGGTAPALWSYEMDTNSTTTNCFNGVTKVTNVGDIPTGWK